MKAGFVFQKFSRFCSRFFHSQSGRELQLAPAVEPLETRLVMSIGFVAGPVSPSSATHEIPLGLRPGSPIEPTVSVNHADPSQIVISSQEQLRVSHDAGTTFSRPVNFNRWLDASTTSSGDTDTAFDAQGRLFWANLAANDSGRSVAVAQLDPLTGKVIGNLATVPNPNDLSDDKEALAADANPASPFANNLYVVFQEFSDVTPGGWEVMFSRSTDHAKTWSQPVKLSDSTVEGFTWPSDVAVAANGDVYVAYHSQPDLTDLQFEGAQHETHARTISADESGNTPANPNGTSGQTFVLRSTDGGLTFSQKTLAFGPGESDMTFNRQDAPSGNIPGTHFWTAGSAQPWVLPDPVRSGNVYVVTSDDPDNAHGSGDDSNVVIARSSDNGQTWTHSTISSGPHNSAQLFPTAAIDPFGDIAVAWYDNRRGLTDNHGDYLLDVYATYSADGGAMWAPEFVVNNPAHPIHTNTHDTVDRFFGPPATTRIGEYFGLDLLGGTAYVAWNGDKIAHHAVVGNQTVASTFSISGALTVNGDDNGVATNDVFTLRLVPHHKNLLEVLVNGQRQYAGLLSSLTGGITFNGLNGDDVLKVDLAHGNPIPAGGIVFNGADGNDSVLLAGGKFKTSSYTFNTEQNGSIALDRDGSGAAPGSQINFTGADLIVDKTRVVHRAFEFTGGAETITFGDDGRTHNNFSKINSTLGVPVVFTDPGRSLVINANVGDGPDAVQLFAPDARFHANVGVFGSSGADTIVIRGERAREHVVINGGDGDDTITGGRGNDVLSGGDGNDVIIGGRGHDRLIGGLGDDTLLAVDRTRDVISGGDGDDKFSADRRDKVIGCEIRLSA